MSPPDTNLEKQKRRHRGPLVGMAAVTIFGVALILYWLGEIFAAAPAPDGAEEEITPAEIRQGDVDVPADAPTRTVGPEDPEVQIEP